jgi:intracellular multiplication protein IcmT
MAAWRDSGLRARILGTDARVTLVVLGFILHMRKWTFGLVVAALLFFGALEYFGYPLEAALRAARAWLAGPEIVVRRRSRWRR